jgi:hypothetical protein
MAKKPKPHKANGESKGESKNGSSGVTLLPPRSFHGNRKIAQHGLMPKDPRIAKGLACTKMPIKELRAMARYYTEDAIFTIYEIMANQSVDADVRLEAAGMLLDRGWGKPTQTTNLNVRDANIRDLTTAEILQKLAAEGALGPEESEEQSTELH